MGAQYIKRAAASLGTVLLVWTFLASGAHAAENETFGLTPYPERASGIVRRTFAIPLGSGSIFEDAIRVYNRTDQPLDLLLYAADARAANDGTITVAFRGSRPTGLASWIKLSRTAVSLPRRGSAVVSFRVTVQSGRPSPDLGAIVVENTARGLRAELVRRLHVVVRTTPPGSPTTSTKVRAFTFRSGWTIVAIAGLIVAGALVWLARRRARRSREDVEPSEPEPTRTDETPVASRPVLHRFGRTDTDPKLVALGSRETFERRRAQRRRPERDERPLLDEVAFIEDEEFEEDETDEVELRPPVPKPRPARKPSASKPAARKPAPKKTPKTEPDDKKLDYIPLEDL